MLGMETLGHRICRHRRNLGLTQTQVALASGVSLATVQNIEAGRTNPTWSTIRKVTREVALAPGWTPASPDWDVLVALGLPMVSARSVQVARKAERLVRELAPALVAAAEGALAPRELDALRALLLALRTHFPVLFRTHWERSPPVRILLADEPDGRTIKLYRITRATLSEYL